MNRGRNYSQSNEWEERDDFNSSTYDAQYPDEDSSGGVNLDHCRLYIKNIPKGLNDEGLRAAFAKFGTLVEVFLSKDPTKMYALVKYTTPGEANLAMMKMNRTEPLRLQINIAHKSKARTDRSGQNRNWQDRTKDKSDRSNVGNRDREDSASVASRGRTPRVQDDIPNGDNMDDLLMEDDYGFSDILDPNLHLELETLKLEQLKVREEQLQCKQRVILLKQAERKPMAQNSNRCILPDGKIVVRNNNNERDSRDADVSFSAGAGDSLILPGLQRVAARTCVVCGAAADAFCAACGITPYCAERCQRRDWHERHSAVCHNLARMNNERGRAGQDFSNNEPKSQPAMPLRRPHGNTPNKRDNQERRDTGGGGSSNFTSKASVKSAGSNGRDERSTPQDKPRQQPANNRRNFNQERDNEPAKASPVTPKPEPQTEQPSKFQGRFNKQQERFNRTPQAPPKPEAEESKVEPVRPAAAAPSRGLTPKTAPEPTIKSEAVKSQEVPQKDVVKPASVSDVTPTRKLVPKNYLVEKLKVGDTIVMSVDAKASDCRMTRGDYVCLTLAEAFELQYSSLCEDFVEDCNKDAEPVKLIPGETVSYFNPDDCGWYRARCLNSTTLALIDSAKIVSVSPADKCRRLPSKYEAVPEFCAVLASKEVELGANLNCEILGATAAGYKISMTNVETEAHIGEAEVFRWLPTVEYQSASPVIPEVSRPPLTDNSKVLLVLADTLDKVFVRPADSESQRQYNDVLQLVLLHAMDAKPLSSPPRAGQTVIGKFTDGMFYRALVRRVNVKQNKYQIEYAEYGNIEVSTLENLYPCPADCDISTVPTLVSMCKLPPTTLSPAATDYVKQLLEEEEIILTLPGGLKTAPSGSEATLTIAKNKVDLGKKLIEMSTPEWKKIEERGGDVVQTEHIMFDVIQYTPLPPEGCTVDVLDISVLKGGTVSGYDRDNALAKTIFNELTEKMNEYCNSELGREPYLPKLEELCITQLPPYPQWFRAVFLGLESGPGSSVAKVCYLDYGNIDTVPVSLLRKMMPEFIVGLPVLGLYLGIRNFPADVSDEMLARAVQHMNIDAEGRGTLTVTNCEDQGDGVYSVDAPELLAAMRG